MKTLTYLGHTSVTARTQFAPWLLINARRWLHARGQAYVCWIEARRCAARQRAVARALAGLTEHELRDIGQDIAANRRSATQSVAALYACADRWRI
jgi:hypothetical protein